VVAANAWMNAPSGFTLDSAGKIVEVDPWQVIFNDAMPLMALHMVIAAYVVGGFLIASVYAVGLLRGRRDRYHRLGFIIPFSVAAVAIFLQMAVGDSLARWVYSNQPTKFAAIEMVPQTSSDVPETLLGHLNSDGTVTGGIPLPGVASWLSDPSTGTATVVQGLNAQPADTEPTVSQVNTVHLAWDVMVGLGTLLCLLAVWYWATWIIRRDLPASRWFLRVAAAAGVLAVVTLEAGWVVSEVGRQPWIVYNLMRVEDAATGNTGVWITFVAVVALYIGVGTTTILVLRGMSARYRRQDDAVEAGEAGDGGQGDDDASDVPYGPSIDLRQEQPTPAGVRP
jgi:cytochrome d ubiquinol oxidase subunit I